MQAQKFIVEGDLTTADRNFALMPGDARQGEIAKAANLRGRFHGSNLTQGDHMRDQATMKISVTSTTAPRQPIGHVLKTHPQQFQEVIEGAKPFEVRKDDRDFARGDTVVLVEYDPAAKQHTGRSTTRVIGFLGRGAPYPAGHCAFMLEYGEACAPQMSMPKSARY